MMTREGLIASIEKYVSPYREETAFKDRFLILLSHPRAFFRDHLPGHITASAWITDRAGKSALLTHHAKLDRWLQPGGHADGEENVVAVSKREATEETGLASLELKRSGIFDLDIHTIPARAGFPEHLHYDIRFLFAADRREPLVVTAESKDLAWIPLGRLAEKTGNNISIARMAEKARPLL